MDARGQRIIVFGDSLSKHAHDSSPEIWDVDEGSDRQSSQPGDLLASLLAEQGADAVRVNARVGRSAFNFWQRENTTALLGSDQAFAPTKVVIILGTNDADSGVNVAVDATMMSQLKSAYEDMGAEVWAIGPVTYNNVALNAKSEPIVDMMQSIFSGRFIDGRPLSVQAGRAGDGVHFGSDAARQTALNMAAALIETPSPKNWLTWLVIGAGALVVGGLAYSWWKHGSKGLYGPPMLGDGFNGYRVAYLTDGAKRTLDTQTLETKEAAQRLMNAYKRRGMTTWVEDDSGVFVPVKGAMRQPKHRGSLEGSKDDDPPHERFHRLMRDPDPASMEIIEDMMLENEDKLTEWASPKGARNGYFEINAAGAPRDQWKKVNWQITPSSHGRYKIEFRASNGKTRAEYEMTVQGGSLEYARKVAAADGWAIAKMLKHVPMSTSEKTLKALLDKELDKDNSLEERGSLFGDKPKASDEDEPGTSAWESKTWPVRDKFRQLIRDEDPSALAVAEDLLLENGLKVSDVAAIRGSRDRGRRGVFHLEPFTHVDKPTNVHWDLEPATGKESDAKRTHLWDNRLEVIYEGKRITWKRLPDQIDPKHWSDTWHVPITAKFADAKRLAASDAWAVAKAIKALPRGSSDEAVRNAILEAANSTPTYIDDVSELYGNQVKWPSLSLTEAERRRRARERQGK
jgi:GDSL-like lipase/acylhydrolase family protein